MRTTYTTTRKTTVHIKRAKPVIAEPLPVKPKGMIDRISEPHNGFVLIDACLPLHIVEWIEAQVR